MKNCTDVKMLIGMGYLVRKYGISNIYRLFCTKRSPTVQIKSFFKDNMPVNDGNEYVVQGWVRSIRKMKDLVFFDVVDGSSPRHLQVVISKKMKNPLLVYGASVSALGVLSKNQQGQLELQANTVSIVGESSPEKVASPFTAKQSVSYDYCRQYLHLRPKVDHFSALLRLRHSALLAIQNFFSNEGFINIHTPILTSNDCEGAGEVFEVLKTNEKTNENDRNGFFGTPAYLTVSGQLHLEAACRSLCKVYTTNPTFRAENSKSRLHLSEFYMIEAEEAFMKDIHNLLNLIESCIKYLTKELVENCGEDLNIILKYNETDTKTHFNMLQNCIEKPFIRLEYKEAVQILQANEENFGTIDCDEKGFTKEQELFLVQHFNEIPVFVYNWPRLIKPFYMKTLPNSNLVAAVDLLTTNVGELCGGSLREDNLKILEEELIKLKLSESLNWYLDLRRFGNVPTGGFGMGFERFLQWFTSIPNIKDVIPFPRWPHSLQM